MVVFTCQHCGSSLKKNQVESHYGLKCRNAVYVTCVDCLKDFGKDYVGHTSCVTEAERYGGQNYTAKPVAVKQNAWLQVVQSVANDASLTKDQRAFLQKCAHMPNVPRKLNPFLNFAQNVNKGIPVAFVKTVYEILEKEFVKAKEKEKSAGKTNDDEVSLAKQKKRKTKSESSDCSSGDVSGTDKKKKKKKARINSRSEDLPQPQPQPQEEPQEQEAVVEEPAPVLTKKEKKKHSKKEKYAAEVAAIESGESPVVPREREGKGKKNKDKQGGSEEKENKAAKHKSKKKIEEEPPLQRNLNQTLAPPEESEEAVPEKYKFRWDQVILAVLRKEADREMTLKRLTKKVMSEYQTHYGQIDDYDTLLSKFNKKLYRTAGVLVSKDRAILIQ